MPLVVVASPDCSIREIIFLSIKYFSTTSFTCDLLKRHLLLIYNAALIETTLFSLVN